MSANDSQRAASWASYYRHHENRPASALLHNAMDSVGPAHCKQAIDLGCGAGNETFALLKAGWRVLAIDQAPQSILRVQSIGAGFAPGSLQVMHERFETLKYLPEAQLIHAGMALPFCHPASFMHFWGLIVDALRPDGVFVGQLFGDRDDWSHDCTRTFHSEGEARALLNGLELITFNALEYDGNSLRGPKHWHLFEIIARKPRNCS
ncbi:methyltransferase domain-containing protein [Pseudomonas qingdaonensis]|uniref:Methyltransferase domain-containing protein n=1 Tax=Pseudomonas qingdaonensis TaxID=2056231 RepID=A0ABX8DX31_9PSED|nr:MULTISPECIES: methyltransferase domain-containing protein [Pseudomonas]MDD1954326.1 methyltransferase domain-containing protein [Pseudomonas sp. 8209]QVL20333.1 methyltransferase domain-containing protein [Pseudomonas qingdaonensis]